MTERDIEADPYRPDEQRVVDYLVEITQGLVGAGDDPIGFLIASHRQLTGERASGLIQAAPGTLLAQAWADRDEAIGYLFRLRNYGALTVAPAGLAEFMKRWEASADGAR